MIAIIGSTEDDISYISNKLTNATTEHVSKIPVMVGLYAGREVAVCFTGRGQALASLITGLVIDKFDPYLVINIGGVSSFVENLPQGAIFLTERVYNIDVDLSPIGRFKFGQTPGFNPYFNGVRDLISRVKHINSRYNNEIIKSGICLSTNKFVVTRKEIDQIISDNFANIPDVMAIDTESAGVATACALYEIPYFGFKTVSYELGKNLQLVTRVRSVVEKTPLIGSYIIALLEELNEKIAE